MTKFVDSVSFILDSASLSLIIRDVPSRFPVEALGEVLHPGSIAFSIITETWGDFERAGLADYLVAKNSPTHWDFTFPVSDGLLVQLLGSYKNGLACVIAHVSQPLLTPENYATVVRARAAL